jgi:hypothetical protein
MPDESPNTGDAESTPPPPPDAVPHFSDTDLVLRREESGAFLFNPETADLSCLNDVGTLVWEEIDGQKTVSEISRSVAARFDDVTGDAVLEDVRSFLGDLVRLGYVRME